MAVLQHAVVIVDPRKLVPCVDEKGIVQPCRQDSDHSCKALLAAKHTDAMLHSQKYRRAFTVAPSIGMHAGSHMCVRRLCHMGGPKLVVGGIAHAWVVHVMTQGRHHERQLLTGCDSCSVCHQPDKSAR